MAFRRLLAATGLALALSLGAGPAFAAPAIWEVSDADSKVWFLGSLHVLPADVEWRTPLLEELLAKSDHVYFETDVGPLGMMAITLKMVMVGVQHGGAPWLDRLSPEQLDTLTAAIEPLGLTLDNADAYPPWVLELQIEGRIMFPDDAAAASATRLDMQSGVDVTLQGELPLERKAYFETPGQQMDILAGGTLDEQIAHLLAAISEPVDGQRTSLDDMVTDWVDGDVDALAEGVATELEGDDAFAARLLYDRNNNWIAPIKALLAENHEDLIVVGAAHLLGDGSVLDLLAKDGYTVRRVQ